MDNKKVADWLTAILAFGSVALLIAGFIGWCLNIGHLIRADHITAEFVIRVIGIFMAPLGAVMGYF